MWLRVLVGFTFIFAGTSFSPVELRAADAARPNIVFIFSDDLTCQAVSAYGEKRRLLETPNMDRIAREGMRFDRCLVTNSIYGPSRATILMGKYSHLNGFYNNSNSRLLQAGRQRLGVARPPERPAGSKELL